MPATRGLRLIDSASTPGSFLPSRARATRRRRSRRGRTCRPAPLRWIAATLSPPPTTREAGEAAMASATPRVPFGEGVVLEETHRAVPEDGLRTAAASRRSAATVSRPDVERHLPCADGVRRRPSCPWSPRWNPRRRRPRGEGPGPSSPRPSARMLRARASLSSSTRLLPRVEAAAPRGRCWPWRRPPTARPPCQERLDHLDLVRHLRAAQHRHEGLLRHCYAPCSRAASSRCIKSPAPRSRIRRGQRDTDAWARCAAPKASLT